MIVNEKLLKELETYTYSQLCEAMKETGGGMDPLVPDFNDLTNYDKALYMKALMYLVGFDFQVIDYPENSLETHKLVEIGRLLTATNRQKAQAYLYAMWDGNGKE